MTIFKTLTNLKINNNNNTNQETLSKTFKNEKLIQSQNDNQKWIMPTIYYRYTVVQFPYI
ncbi:hypothetical protein DDB_G0287719 [Dictyostelium discoideum AX4]|uniref:Uncharacterized protein n=1 Tax=Dictyostelium discoideum TaxID=44689 RepID=Q54JZ5_DICDI|nr:hypothetical protein DDB_G0287719 [Dictyostelium discoideum AX4]EAL63506.1 hypothetical protein DDB_G0287719 [Dictyostelium discoideum AX4]|eukprot:XP_637007.1 hypothetical protein DDB_G0287719 [Dictyostelium discoideum AX4]